MEWISVEDRLPDASNALEITTVIGATKAGDVYEVYFSRGKFYSQYNPYARICETVENVTHWQPLPEPPQE